MEGGGLLRGTASVTVDVTRILHNITTNIASTETFADDNHHSSIDNNGDSSVDDEETNSREDYLVTFISAVIVLLALGLALCICQMFLSLFLTRIFQRNHEVVVVTGDGDQSLFVDDGRVLELNPQQRRAVLEAILSETSKVRKILSLRSFLNLRQWDEQHKIFLLAFGAIFYSATCI